MNGRSILHMTLTTGHVRQSPLSEVASEAVQACLPLLTPGEHRMPGVRGGYTLRVPAAEHGWLGTVYQGTVPVCTIGIARTKRGAAEVWPHLHRLHLTAFPDQPIDQPTQLPWVAAVLLASAPAWEWLGDFERCLAWAWLIGEESFRAERLREQLDLLAADAAGADCDGSWIEMLMDHLVAAVLDQSAPDAEPDLARQEQLVDRLRDWLALQMRGQQ